MAHLIIIYKLDLPLQWIKLNTQIHVNKIRVCGRRKKKSGDDCEKYKMKCLIDSFGQHRPRGCITLTPYTNTNSYGTGKKEGIRVFFFF